MRKLFGSLIVLALCASPALAQKVFVDYDKNYDFSKIRTFSWAATDETSLAKSAPLVHSRIVNSIEHHLTLGGLTEVKEGPDVFVTYHTSTQEQQQLNTTNFGYGYGAGWYYGGGGISSSTTNVYTYTYGTLIIDIWDAGRKEMVWRGSATAIVKANPEKLGKQIEKALTKMVHKWQKMYEGPGL